MIVGIHVSQGSIGSGIDLTRFLTEYVAFPFFSRKPYVTVRKNEFTACLWIAI